MKPGVKAGIDAAGGRDAVRGAADEREAAQGEQLALLAEDNAALDGLLPLAPPPVERRGAGRPPGARNRRTQALAAYYLGRYGDPLEGLLAMGTGDLAHTHRKLAEAAVATGLPIGGQDAGALTVMGLLQFKRQCLEAALPYLHAKLAPTDDKGEPVVPILALATVRPGAAERVAQGGGFSIEDLVEMTPGGEDEVQQDQALSGSSADGSHGDGSHGEG